jgi:hypothetical protein
MKDTIWQTLTRHAQAQERTSTMPKLNQIFTSPSLKVEDLNKKRVNLTIKEVEIKEFDGDPKPVLHFKETEKTFVCNKTNSNMIASLTEQDDTDDWVGYRITLRPDMTTFNGKPTPCIRVDSELPEQKAKAKAAVADDDDEIPF